MREGLRVWLDDALLTQVRKLCTVAELQLMLCGVDEIDVDDWESSTEYRGGYSEGSPQVQWFWAKVRRMTTEDRSKLLHFCTGSARAPATGFANLMGYAGGGAMAQQQRFTIERLDVALERLPVASTCFNALKLPPYTTENVLVEKLQLVFEAEGFHEGAIARS